MDRNPSKIIREAIEQYRRQHMTQRTSLRGRRPASVGGPLQPLEGNHDLLDEMIHPDK